MNTINFVSMMYWGTSISQAIKWNMNNLISLFGTFAWLRQKSRRQSRCSCSEINKTKSLTEYCICNEKNILCSLLNNSSIKLLEFPCASRTMMTFIYSWWRLCIWMERIRHSMFENMIETSIDGCKQLSNLDMIAPHHFPDTICHLFFWGLRVQWGSRTYESILLKHITYVNTFGDVNGIHPTLPFSWHMSWINGGNSVLIAQ